MEKLIPFTSNDLAKVTNYRYGEIKFGEKMFTIPKDTEVLSFLKSCEAKYVLFGIPEDIGVRANSGRPGTASAWESAIKSIANIGINFNFFIILMGIIYWFWGISILRNKWLPLTIWILTIPPTEKNSES